MNKYRVSMAAAASVSTSIVVDADSEAQAETLALQAAQSGNVIWEYDGADDHSIEIGSVDTLEN